MFFELEGRDYHDAIRQGQTKVLDWADSLTMAIDVAYRLGFRRLFLAGCDMRVAPPTGLIRLAEQAELEPIPHETLAQLTRRCREAGVTKEQLDACDDAQVYHFDERKPFGSTVSTDEHYFRIAQALRLSRRCFSAAGLEITSVTPGSRLNDYFPYQTVEAVCRSLLEEWGDAAEEVERGRYHADGPRLPDDVGPMRDFPPPCRDRKAEAKPAVNKPAADKPLDPRPLAPGRNDPVFVAE